MQIAMLIASGVTRYSSNEATIRLLAGPYTGCVTPPQVCALGSQFIILEGRFRVLTQVPPPCHPSVGDV